MKAKSIQSNSINEFQSALQQTIDTDFKPTLAVVFISISQDRNHLS